MTTKEDYLKNLILKRWTLKDFAATIDMPYGTLYSILRNVDGGSLHNILKICSGLHISADTLAQIGKNQSACLLNDDMSMYYRRSAGSEIYAEYFPYQVRRCRLSAVERKPGYADTDHQGTA